MRRQVNPVYVFCGFPEDLEKILTWYAVSVYARNSAFVKPISKVTPNAVNPRLFTPACSEHLTSHRFILFATKLQYKDERAVRDNRIFYRASMLNIAYSADPPPISSAFSSLH